MIITDAISLSIVVLITVADLWLLRWQHPTISQRLRQMSFTPFAWGALAGHFWGPDYAPVGNWWLSIGLLLGSCAVAWCLRPAVWGKPWRWSFVLYMLAGVFPGARFWPQ